MPPLLPRLPVRLRVTLAFTGAMALVLVVVGGFLYLRLAVTLHATLDRGLTGRADDIASLVAQTRTPARTAVGGRPAGPLVARSRDVAQVLRADGTLLSSSRPQDRRPLLRPDEVRRAARGPLRVTHDTPVIDGDGVRLLARPAGADGRRYVVVVGTAVEPYEDAQHDLGGLLLVGGPVALLLAALAGYGAASGALAPVERMRRRAERVSAGGGERLPVPPADDELGRLGTTLNAMLDRLDAAYEHERRFVADASHELRTPLSILKAELELATRDATTLPEFRAAVASAAEETDRLVALAEDLLVVARAEQGRLPIRPEPLAAAALLDDVVARFGRRAADRGVHLRRTGGDLPLVADRRLLEQAVGNVVDNALRHGAHEVTVHAEAGALVVVDDGAGFPPAFAARAFERFSRADPGRGGEGAGLGLAIVAAIAEAHGGRATATASPGGGATVRIELGPGARGVRSSGAHLVRQT